MSKQPKPQVVSLDSAREDASYWLKDCIFENGKPLPILANAVVGIRAIMPMAFAFDEVLRAALLMEPLKGDRDTGDLLAPRAQPQKPSFRSTPPALSDTTGAAVAPCRYWGSEKRYRLFKLGPSTLVSAQCITTIKSVSSLVSLPMP
jgi:hypothetical protein